jgi:hypothetical protein
LLRSFSGYPSRDMTAGLGDLLEAAQRAGGLGELSLALARRRLVSLRHLTDERADVVEGAGADGMDRSLTAQSRDAYSRKPAAREKGDAGCA